MPTNGGRTGFRDRSGQQNSSTAVRFGGFRNRSFSDRARQAATWARREIILVMFAAFIAGLGAGAAEALISWLAG